MNIKKKLSFVVTSMNSSVNTRKIEARGELSKCFFLDKLHIQMIKTFLFKISPALT